MRTIYRQPVKEIQQTELIIDKSRFITSVGFAETTSDARAFIAHIATSMPDASHHVYAFRIGYGNATVEGMSDAGEPSGTAGPPTLAVVRGSDIGDIVLVTTRYFGGIKLGTGGLVRAYTQSAQLALEQTITVWNIPTCQVLLELPYSYFEVTKRLIEAHAGKILSEEFTGNILLELEFPENQIPAFSVNISDLSAGQIQPIML